MTKKKIKAGELTLNQIVEIAEKYKGKCMECPLVDVGFIDCFDFCEGNDLFKRIVKRQFKKEIEVEEDDLYKENK